MQFKKVVAIGVLTVMLASVGTAQFFGGGIPVFDSAALFEALIQSGHMTKQIGQLVQTYNKITDQYNHMKKQAEWLAGGRMNAYRAIKTVWREVKANDAYNRNADWVRAVNTGVNAAGAWEKITRSPDQYSHIPAAIADIVKNDYATVELQDGSAINTIDLVGRIRQAGPQREAVLEQLENDSFTDSAAMQTEAAQLNKANALLILNARLAMDGNRLSASLTEMNLLRMKQERDAQVHAINQAVYSQKRSSFYMTDTQGGPSQALRNFSVSLQ
jgi:hypothetical protein